jgi:hypothetical protein
MVATLYFLLLLPQVVAVEVGMQQVKTVVLEVAAITTPPDKLAVLELLTKVITAEMVRILFLEAVEVVRVPQETTLHLLPLETVERVFGLT